MLASGGIEVTLLEAAPELPRELRASTFHPATLDLLDRFGVFDEMTRRGLIAPRFAYRDRRQGSGGRVRSRCPSRCDQTTRSDCNASSTSCARSCLTDSARWPMSRSDSGLRWWSAVDHSDAASVRLASGETLMADAVVAADGAASAVRKSLGLGFDGMTYEDRYLVLSTPFEMADHLDDLAYVNYISDPDEWLVLLRTAGSVAGVVSRWARARLTPTRSGIKALNDGSRESWPATSTYEVDSSHYLPGPPAGGRPLSLSAGWSSWATLPTSTIRIGRHGHERRHPRCSAARGVFGRCAAGRHRR